MGKKLRSGFTTGTAAAAAAKSALYLLLTGQTVQKVDVELLTGDTISIPVGTCRMAGKESAVCTVIKDAGDDPDVTHRAVIGARVSRANGPLKNTVRITGGEGVGVVTKPGLEVPTGEPAINSGPRKMITRSVREVLDSLRSDRSVSVEVFVPEGKTLARKTLNQRLGIIGGISILGTTGIVKPMSHEAYVATIRSSLSVAKASGLTCAVMTTGRRSERYAQSILEHLPEESFVQIGDYFKASVEMAVDKNFQQIILAVFFGKALKMAQGVPHTHAAKSRLTMETLVKWVRQITGDESLAHTIAQCNTAREALSYLRDGAVKVVSDVGTRMTQAAAAFSGPKIQFRGIIFDYNGSVILDTHHEAN
jgi:cobalt-precorrin-5B (C1)-methyltransferase